MLLAEYRRAMAAEEFYDQLRRASGAMPQRQAARSEMARCVFESFYSAE